MAAPPPHRIRVVCRLRPADDAAVEVRGASLIVPKNRSVRESRDELPAQGGLRFSVDAVYDQEASQVSVFEGEAAKLVDGVVDGVTGTLLAYGQTGAGKTFTVLGRGGTASGAKYDDRGLVPRCLERLFATAMRKRRSGRVVDVRLSVCEVYNETVVDLLRPPPEKGQPVGLPVVERNGLTEIKGLEKAPVASAADALQLLYDAEINRAVASHAMNCASSRSHLVVTGHVVCSHGEDITEAKLTIVDLAGAERVNQTQSRDGTATLREAGYINKSLAFLEQVVVALGDDKPRLHIPYRSSKLTHALKDALGGTCRTTLIACVWPSAAQADQTRATLRFAARMGRITCAPVVGRRRSASEDAASKVVARKLRNEVAVLRAELAARDLIRGTPPPAYAYGPLTDADEVQKCVKLARAYVDDGTVPPVITVGQVRAVYAALRDLCSQAPPAATPAAPPSETPMKQSRRLFATPLASPPPPTEQLTSSNLEAHQSMTNEELFKRWRSSTNDQEVIDVEEDLRACASRKKELKTLSKKLVTDVNDAKTRIDEELRALQATGGADEFGDDSEAAHAVASSKIRDAKRVYRSAFEARKQAQMELVHVDARRKYLFRLLVAKFQAAHDLVST